jgi:hypothetical protein
MINEPLQVIEEKLIQSRNALHALSTDRPIGLVLAAFLRATCHRASLRLELRVSIQFLLAQTQFLDVSTRVARNCLVQGT